MECVIISIKGEINVTKVLALDTSSMVASACVMDDDKILGEITYNYKKQHSTVLLPMIDEILSSLDLSTEDMDCIACASGPGSFTGLRIGTATAKGLCHGSGRPLIGVPTLDGLAFNLAYCSGIICPVIDALHSNVYTAIYRWEEDTLYKLEDYAALSLDELFERLGIYNERVFFLGDGIFAYKDKIKEGMGKNAEFAPANISMPKASSIGALALKRFNEGSTDDYLSFAPFYLRKPQAEREYQKLHGGKK